MALDFKLITKQNLIYKFCPKYALASCFFTNFVDAVANELKRFKQAILGFIGILEKTQLMRITGSHKIDHKQFVNG